MQSLQSKSDFLRLRMPLYIEDRPVDMQVDKALTHDKHELVVSGSRRRVFIAPTPARDPLYMRRIKNARRDKGAYILSNF